jgi:hypothetical protein
MNQAYKDIVYSSYHRTILDLMSRVEDNDGRGLTLQEINPELESRVWDAIDSRNVARMSAIIKELERI